MEVGYTGENHHLWRGGKVIRGHGYIGITNKNHPRSTKQGYVLESIVVAEKSLGKFLPPKSVVHHINHIKTDNRPENLVICENQAYHLILHERERALVECGSTKMKQCIYCRNWYSPEQLYVSPNGHLSYHRKCYNKYRKGLNKCKQPVNII